ncbi:MAG: hypothetical protein EOP36_10550 [Rubrivivax sp.]|nr:MAG: hypothetical protein EOP36_10550 [Rubrivivax sp.]
MNLYVLALGFVMLGACLRDYFDSALPLAACASTSVMLSVPLFQQLRQRYLGRGTDHPAE